MKIATTKSKAAETQNSLTFVILYGNLMLLIAVSNRTFLNFECLKPMLISYPEEICYLQKRFLPKSLVKQT